ncbi:GNAT family N-acetyltransferase [Tropicimonas sp. IMCC34011]|uniref:GNAT family N-acetyltransferase n=1 Tax=Tropicimonas sp. IMCC34011 TaxID=2248759 RepID=UPI000E2856D7|nr:GNAT family N-acyltransferase [Tropicimonas sp. IMCC34011]
MLELGEGRYVARPATTSSDLSACLALRAAAFRGGAPDEDAFDGASRHVMVEDRRTGEAACTFRLAFYRGDGIARSYSGLRYDLSRLAGFPGVLLELGRFCIRGGAPDADILRLALAALTREVDAAGVTLLFGCSSFPGTDPADHAPALGYLAGRPPAPPDWAPGIGTSGTVPLARFAPDAPQRRGLLALPPLLRSYLGLGGWTSDHAVIDRDLGTTHVFTGVEIARIPPARARALRLVADAAQGA